MADKKYTVIDAQLHYVPREVAKKAAAVAEAAGKTEFIARIKKVAASTTVTVNDENSLDNMVKCGVDMAVLVNQRWLDAGLESCKVINDGLSELVKKYPDRFIPCADVPYLEGPAAIDELERAINYLGLKGVTVFTSQQGTRLDDQQLKPFFKRVSQLRIPVVVHPIITTPIWGGEKHNMSGSVAREYEIIKAFVEVFSGVLPEFPDINFLFAHYGGGVPFLLGRIMSWYEPENSVKAEQLIGLPPRTIKEFEDSKLKDGFNKLLDQVYFDMAGTGGWMSAVKQALLAIKPERLCFATDYPHEMGRPADLMGYIAGIRDLDIPEEDKIMILGGNIKKLFKV